MKTKKKATLEDLIKSLNLKTKKEKVDSHAYGKVVQVNKDGSYQVSLNGSSTTVKCARLAGAKEGDTVFVTIMKNGFAVVTNTLGGDADAKDALEMFTRISATSKAQVIAAGSVDSLKCEFDVPKGYRVIGVLTLQPVETATQCCITGWTIAANDVLKIYFRNNGSAQETLQYRASVLLMKTS